MPRAKKTPTQAVQAATGQAYGNSGAQMASQQAVPLPDNAAATASIVQQAAQQSQNPTAAQAQTTTSPPMGPAAGSLGAFNRPSEQAQTPVTNGIATGAGAGPEALGQMTRPQLSQTIAQIAQASGNADLMRLAQSAQAQGN